MSPVAWGQAQWGNLLCRSRPDTLASEPSPEARANVQAVPQGKAWRRHDSSDGYDWESPRQGWWSRLSIGEDSNGGGCISRAETRAYQRGATSPPGQNPMSPVAWGQAQWGNLLCRSRPDTLASEPSPEARANVQAVPQGKAWRRHDISDGYYWESPRTGWSSRLCIGEDSNGGGCIGKGSRRHPRCLEPRHERKEA